MATDNYQLTLNRWEFPKPLHPNKANFRFVAQIRFFGEKGSPETANNALPGLDSYWECDWRKHEDRRYVGPDVTNGEPGNYGMVDPAKINPYEKVAFLVRASRLQSINFTLYDVDRKDFWDKLLGVLAKVVEGLLGRLKDVLPGSIDLPDSVKATITRALAGPGDRIIGTAGKIFPDPPVDDSVSFTIRDGDYKGTYKINFGVTRLSRAS